MKAHVFWQKSVGVGLPGRFGKIRTSVDFDRRTGTASPSLPSAIESWGYDRSSKVMGGGRPPSKTTANL